MKVVSYFETSVLKRQTQRRLKPQDGNLYCRRRFNLDHEKRKISLDKRLIIMLPFILNLIIELCCFGFRRETPTSNLRLLLKVRKCRSNPPTRRWRMQCESFVFCTDTPHEFWYQYGINSNYTCYTSIATIRATHQ
jgi:hypothetical protein